MADNTDDLNLIKFRTGATQTTDIDDNIARFNFDKKTLTYGGVVFGLSEDALNSAVSKKMDTSALTEYLKAYALSADVPTLSTIRSIADTEINKANASETLNHYATSASVESLKKDISAKTTIEEVEAKGYMTSAYADTRYAKLIDIITDTSGLTNSAGFITSANIPTDNTAFTNGSHYITSGDIPTSNTAFVNDAEYITIDEVPTSNTAFTNDAKYITSAVTALLNFYDKSAVDSMISSGFKTVTATTLPATGDPRTLYFILKAVTEEGNVYDEYMYISSKWEKIGSTSIDLSNYYTTAETSSSTEITNALSDYYKKSSTSSSTEIENALENYYTTAETSSSTEITNALGNYYKSSETSSSTEITNALSGKSDTGHTHDYLPLSGGTVSGNVKLSSSTLNIENTSNEVSGTIMTETKKVSIFSYNTLLKQNKLSIGVENNDGFNFIYSNTDTPFSILDYNHSNNTGSVSADSKYLVNGGVIYSLFGSKMGEYLALSGGTVSGLTKISNNQFSPLVVNRTTDENPTIAFSKQDTVLGRIGVAGGNPTFWDSANTSSVILTSKNSAHTHSYLPLSGGVMSGRVNGISGSVDIAYDGTTLLGYNNTGCSNCTAGTVVASYSSETHIRSNADNLYHYNANDTKNYKIIDDGNALSTLSGKFATLGDAMESGLHSLAIFGGDLHHVASDADSGLTFDNGSNILYVSGSITTPFVSGNVSGTANYSKQLSNYYTSRQTSANIGIIGDGSLRQFKATTTMNTGKPESDGTIMHLAWDNTGGYDTQIFIPNSTGFHMGIRTQSGSSSFSSWKYLAYKTELGAYLPLSGGMLTGNVYFSQSNFSLGTVPNYTSDGFSTSSITVNGGCAIMGSIKNVGYTITTDVLRAVGGIYCLYNYLQSITSESLYVTSSILTKSGATITVPEGSVTAKDFYGTFHGTADVANSCPNAVPMTGTTSASTISGSIHVGNFAIKQAVYTTNMYVSQKNGSNYNGEIGFSGTSIPDNTSVSVSTYNELIGSPSHSASTISSVTSASTNYLMDAYAIKTYIDSQVATNIRITI